MIPFIFQQFGCGPDEFAAEAVEAFRFAIDRADEARALMDQLHLP